MKWLKAKGMLHRKNLGDPHGRTGGLQIGGLQIGKNEYVKIRGKELKHEKDILYKCGEQTKLFYSYIHKKLKLRENIV